MARGEGGHNWGFGSGSWAGGSHIGSRPFRLSETQSGVQVECLAAHQKRGDQQAAVDGHRMGDWPPTTSIKGIDLPRETFHYVSQFRLDQRRLVAHGVHDTWQLQALGEHDHLVLGIFRRHGRHLSHG
jgi:hypothetical protein